MKSLFSYYGGKSKVAKDVWDRFGKVNYYFEPFFGSGAMLWGCPYPLDSIIINDWDGYICNFWRAVKNDPKGVLKATNIISHELEKVSLFNHLGIIRNEFWEKIRTDYFFYDVEVAGQWWWLHCMTIGEIAFGEENDRNKGRLKIEKGKSPQDRIKNLNEIYHFLSSSKVRITCRDWKEMFPKNGLNSWGRIGEFGVFLDPPYSEKANRADKLYSVESKNLHDEVLEFCLGNSKFPKVRIAVCGYKEEYQELLKEGWNQMAWKGHGGYSRIMGEEKQGMKNRFKEVIYFSPSCKKPEGFGIV